MTSLGVVRSVREGMSCIVPVPLLSLLSVDKLESLVCVDMSSRHEDMIKKDSEFNQSDYSSHMTPAHADQIVQWLW